MTVVNLRGINGSGKTTAARQLLDYRTHTAWSRPYVNKFGSQKKGWPMHICDTYVGKVVLHGRYDVQQGGCDTEKDMNVVERGLRLGFQYFPDHHHLFEGFIVSKSSKRFQKLAEDHRNMGWHFVTLNPGLDECVRRVMNRNGGKEPKRDMMQRSLEGDVLRCHRDFTAMGWPRVTLTDNLTPEQFWELF